MVAMPICAAGKALTGERSSNDVGYTTHNVPTENTEKQFVQAKDGRFLVNDNELQLRGFGIGSWMNFEHFMLRIPGSDHQIRQVFAEVCGKK